MKTFIFLDSNNKIVVVNAESQEEAEEFASYGSTAYEFNLIASIKENEVVNLLDYEVKKNDDGTAN